MRILNKHSYWWKNEERQWATQDKSGNWWIYRRKEEPTAVKTKPKRAGQRSNVWEVEHYVILALASALGISLALNIVAILS